MMNIRPKSPRFFNSGLWHEDVPETVPLIQSQSTSVIYKRRWYILALFSLVGLVDGVLWNTWGPINQSAKAVYNWSNTELALIINWGNVMYSFFIFPASYVMDSKGLRLAVVSSLVLMALGNGLRMITMEPTPATWLNNIGQILMGIGGCVPYAGASLLSSTWFPMNQRSTATSIAAMSSYIGDGFAFIVGPWIVKQLGWRELTESFPVINSSDLVLPQLEMISNTSDVNITDPFDVERQQKELFTLFLIEIGVIACLLLLALIYFPAKPPTAPSKSADTQRLHYKEGFITLAKSPQFWVINAAFSPNGVFLGWSSVLGIILSSVGISQDEAGWIGFYMIVASCVGMVTVGRFSDMFSKRIKTFVVTMYGTSALSLTWFSLLTAGVIPFSIAQVYVSCVITGLCLNGTFPLFMEMACESAYPVAEGITCGFLTMVHNTVTVLFIVVLMIPGLGTTWMNWTLLALVVFGLPFIFLYKAERQRSNRDAADSLPVTVMNT